MFDDEPTLPRPAGAGLVRWAPFDDQSIPADHHTPDAANTMAWSSVLNPARLGMRSSYEEYRDTCRCLQTYGEVREFMQQYLTALTEDGQDQLPWSKAMAIAGAFENRRQQTSAAEADEDEQAARLARIEARRQRLLDEHEAIHDA